MATVGRLTRRPEFLRIADGRRKWVAPGLILQALERRPLSGVVGEGSHEARVGFTASAKVGNAVVRNRARRRLRAAAAAILPLHAAPAHDYVLIARAGTVQRRFADLVADLVAGLRRLGLYRADPAATAVESAAKDSHAA